jgi:hypothetical protein
MRTIELNDEFVDQIVATELKDIFLRNVDSDDEHDESIVAACEELLMYILPYDDARKWIIENRYSEK